MDLDLVLIIWKHLSNKLVLSNLLFFKDRFPKQQRTIEKLDSTPGPGAFLTILPNK